MVDVKLGRTTLPDLETAMSYSMAVNLSSSRFCYRTGMNYVSCSPYRVRS